MTAEPHAFARKVLAAFEEAGHFTDAAIAKAGGPSTSTLTKLRNVAKGADTMSEPREPTWSKIDAAADWEPGSARRVWRGGSATVFVSASLQDAHSYVEAPGGRVESGVSNEDLLREIVRSRAESDQIRAAVESLSQRVEKLEERGT